MSDFSLECLANHISLVESGTRPKGGVAKYTEGVPSLSAEHICEDGTFNFEKLKYVPHEFYQNASRGKIQRYDIMVVKDGATTGKSAIVEENFPFKEAMVNEHTFILRAKSTLLPKFCFYALRSEYALKCFSTARKRGVIGSLNQDFVKEIKIPIPPLDEQCRIVARIEELTRHAEEARKLRQKAVEDIGKTFASAIDKIFNDRDEDWTEAPVKQVCGKPQYGYTESANSENVGPRFLRITDIQNGQVDWDNVPYCDCSETHKYQLSDGDIVFTRTGATTGKSYLVRNPPVAVFASYLIRIRPGEMVLPEYVWWYFQSSNYWASVFNGIDDGNRPNMNGTKLGNLKIPFPKSKETQQKIVYRIEGLSDKLNRLRQLQMETDSELEAFNAALLAKAFRGEL